MAQQDVVYNITMESSDGNYYVLYSKHIVFDVISINNTIPSGATITGVNSIRISFNEINMNGRSEDYVEFTLKTADDQTTICDGGWDKTYITPGAYTYRFSDLYTNNYQLSVGKKRGHLHFDTDSEASPSFVFNTADRKSAKIIVNYSYTLPAPSDASTLSLTSKPSEFGGTLVYAIQGDDRCTHKFEWWIGSAYDYNTGLGTGPNKSASIPLNWAAQVPNGTVGTITVKLTTYYNNSQVKSPVQAQFNVNVPSSVVPSLGSLSVSMQPVDPNNQLIRNWNLYIQGQSYARLTASGATKNQNSPIASYHFLDQSGKEIASINSDALSYTYNATLPSYTGKTFNTTYGCYVVDKRGRRSNTVSCPAITVYTYTDPSIGAVSAIRCNSEGKASEEGTYFKLASAFGFTSINERNLTNCRYEISWKEHSASTYSHLKTGSITGLSDSNTTYKFSQKYGGAVGASDYMDPQKQYDIKIKIFDTLGNSIDKEIALGTISYTMFFKSEGRGIGIGKMTEEENIDALEVNPEWAMIWGYLNNDRSKPVRIPGVIYTDSSTTIPPGYGRLGMIWLKAT